MAPTGNLNAWSAGPDAGINRLTPHGRAGYPYPAPREVRGRGRSERGEDHEDLVAVVAGSDTQRPGPAADHLPAQPAVEALEAGAGPQRQVKLLKAHLLAGDAPGLRHQGGANSPALEGGAGLQTVDGCPVRHQRAPLTLDVEPARQDAVGQRQQEPAAPWIQAGDQLGRHRRHLRAVRGREKPHRPTGVADRHPAVDQFSSQPGTDLAGMGTLTHLHEMMTAHARIIPGCPDGVRPAGPKRGTGFVWRWRAASGRMSR